MVAGCAGVVEVCRPEDVGLWPPDDAVEVGTGDELDEVAVRVEVAVGVDVDEHPVRNDEVSTISTTPIGIDHFICTNPSSSSEHNTKMTHRWLVSTDADGRRPHELPALTDGRGARNCSHTAIPASTSAGPQGCPEEESLPTLVRQP